MKKDEEEQKEMWKRKREHEEQWEGTREQRVCHAMHFLSLKLFCCSPFVREHNVDNKVPHIIFSLDQFELFGIDSLTFYLSGFKLERFHEDGKEG